MWQVCQPSHTYFGEGEIQNIGKYMEEAGLEQALLISTPSMVRHGVADKIVEYSNGRIVGVSTHVQPDATVDDANANVEEAKKVNAKCLVALGGGSAIDCTKVTAVAYADGVPAETFLGFQYAPKSTVPIVAIPTTSGSGSELTGDAGMHDPKTGSLGGFLANPYTFAKIAIVDPELTYTVPASVTANTGFDALCHALDALGSALANPYTDALAEIAARMVFENLETAVADGSNKEARRNMAAASHTAAFAFSQTSITGTHATGFAISGRYHTAHGLACAFAPEFWFKENAKVRPDLEGSAKRIGFESVDAMCARMVEMRRNVKIPDTLTELGYEPGDEKLLAQITLEMFPMALNISKPTAEQLEEMYASRV